MCKWVVRWIETEIERVWTGHGFVACGSFGTSVPRFGPVEVKWTDMDRESPLQSGVHSSDSLGPVRLFVPRPSRALPSAIYIVADRCGRCRLRVLVSHAGAPKSLRRRSACIHMYPPFKRLERANVLLNLIDLIGAFILYILAIRDLSR